MAFVTVRFDAFLDVLEDDILYDNQMIRTIKKDYDPARDWFDYGGYYWQNSYNEMPLLNLERDEIECFLRSFYDMYASEIEPGDYTFATWC